jgi:hypothetical protein
MIDLRVVLLSLVLFYNDREVINRLRMEEGVYFPNNVPFGVPIERGDLTFDELTVSEFEEGMEISEESDEIRKIRQIRDVLDNSVQRLYGKDESVTAWADGLGGLRKVQEGLVGVSLAPDKWYKITCRRLSQELGYDPTPLGDPTIEVPLEAAGPYTSYAVLAHREVANKRAYGELSLDDEGTTPNWALSEFDFNVTDVPWWWKKFVSMGKFRKGVPIKKVSKNLKQVETGSGAIWIPDLRVSKMVEDDSRWYWEQTPFTQVSKLEPWWKSSDNPKVKEFMWRFYNYPKSLNWVKVGDGKYQRMAGGMMIGNGKVLWAPVSYRSHNSIEFWSKNDGKTFERKPTRCLYLGPWVIPYKKIADGVILVTKMKQDHNTGLFEYWREKEMDPMEWGSTKRKLLALGAVDAYLGRPWKEYVAPPKAPDFHEGPWAL